MDVIVTGQATAAEQRRELDNLLARGVAGVSISAIDPKNSTEEFNKVAAKAVLFTTDSDAPQIQPRGLYRHRQRRRWPAGGRGDQEGAAQRRQGHDVRRHAWTPTTPASGCRASRTCSPAPRSPSSTSAPTASISRRPRRTCRMRWRKAVSIASSACIPTTRRRSTTAVKEAGKAGKVKIVGFDEDPQTLRGVTDGTIQSTVVQQPFEFGYQSMIDMIKRDQRRPLVHPGQQADHHSDPRDRQDQRRRVPDLDARCCSRNSRCSDLHLLPLPLREGSRSKWRAPLLELAGITKVYPGVIALDDVSLRVARGEVLGLIGENGAGKSTLMKILGGVVAPTAGTIRIDGRDTRCLTVAEATRAGIAFVHQELNVFDNLDVAANVFIGREPLDRRPAGAGATARSSKPGSSRYCDRLGADFGPRHAGRRTCRSRSGRWWRSPRRCRSTRASSSWMSRHPASRCRRPSGCWRSIAELRRAAWRSSTSPTGSAR